MNSIPCWGRMSILNCCSGRWNIISIPQYRLIAFSALYPYIPSHVGWWVEWYDHVMCRRDVIIMCVRAIGVIIFYLIKIQTPNKLCNHEMDMVKEESKG